MAIRNHSYTMSEWRLGVLAETTFGTPATASYQLLNIDGDVSVSTDLTQTLDPRSGVGRTLKTLDAKTFPRGGQLTTITASIVLDTTTSPILHNNALAIAAGTSPAGYALDSAYAPDGVAFGDAGSNIVSLGVVLFSPVADETRYFAGCELVNMTVTYDSATEGGRGHANLTFETRFRPTFGLSAPTVVAYTDTFRYLREFDTLHKFGVKASQQDCVFNKVEYTISNPAVYVGFQGANGDPEAMTRGIPEASVSGMFGLKYDANTANFWESQNAGNTMGFEISDHATWASATFGIRAEECIINSEVTPSQTDAGVFEEISWKATSDGAGDVFEVVV